jgi:serine/threonine protein phosphatase PrpC
MSALLENIVLSVTIGEKAEAGDTAPVLTPEIIFIALLAVLAVFIAAMAIIFLRRSKNAGGDETGGISGETFEEGGLPGMKIYNIQGIGKRDSQQDSFGTAGIDNPDNGVFSVVADGMGGISNGAAMSKLAVSVLLDEFSKRDKEADPAEFLEGSVKKAQKAARAEIGSGEMSGTTVVAVYYKGDNLWFISVGDSRIALYRGGRLTKLNRDHNVAAELDEKLARGEISREAAMAEKTRGSLTSYVGTGDVFTIDRNIKPLKIEKGDILLLMSDGVFGTVTDDELIKAIESGNLKTAGDTVNSKIKNADKKNQDNFTAVFLKI